MLRGRSPPLVPASRTAAEARARSSVVQVCGEGYHADEGAQPFRMHPNPTAQSLRSERGARRRRRRSDPPRSRRVRRQLAAPRGVLTALPPRSMVDPWAPGRVLAAGLHGEHPGERAAGGYVTTSSARRSLLATRSARCSAARPSFITSEPACEVMRAARENKAKRSRLGRAVSIEGGSASCFTALRTL